MLQVHEVFRLCGRGGSSPAANAVGRMPFVIRQEIERLVGEAVRAAMESGAIAHVAPPDIVVERPQNPEHGDYATNVAMRLARAARAAPPEIARAVVRYLPPADAVAGVTVAPPGFINFRLSDDWLKRQVDVIREAGWRFAAIDVGGGKKTQVEFVSANPTGPLTAGNGRGAALGGALANVLEAAGYRVEREYLVNDAGTQTDVFGRTLAARYLQLFGKEIEVPPDGYPDEYMVDLARLVRDEFGDRFVGMDPESPPEEMVLRAVDEVVEWARRDLEAMGIAYDVWFRERSLYGDGENLHELTMRILRESGFLVEKEGAVWFASSQIGEDKDNVVIRSTGRPTYLASDIAYHYDKFVRRGFDRVINVWGADHQGHVSRLKAAVEALGVERERLDILIYQLVRFRRGAETVRLSKRRGQIITVRDVVDEVGADAAKFFFLSRSADSQLEFDLELAKRQSAENPVYYVQYAHARIAGILKHAAERVPSFEDGDLSLLGHPTELALIRKMLLLPELIETMARTLEPHHLPHYAQELATAFHAFYTECRVVSEDVALSKARLKLTDAARVALARTLGLMGVSAPERM